MEFFVANSLQLGKVAQGWRKQLGLTQSQLGALVGLRQAAISSFEKDPSRTGVERMFRILSALRAELVLRSPSAVQSEW